MHHIGSMTSIIWALLGAIGGIVKVLAMLLTTSPLPSRKTIMWLVLANAFISGFSGFLGAVVVSTLTTNSDLHVVAAGICGYLGVAALDIISNWLKQRIAKN